MVQSAMPEKEFLTIPEAAAELSVTVSSVHIALNEGRLTFVIKYGRRLVSRGDLDAYKTRTRPDGEKPKGRPRKMKTYRIDSDQGEYIATSEAPDELKACYTLYNEISGAYPGRGFIKDINEQNWRKYILLGYGEGSNFFDHLRVKEVKKVVA